MAANLQNFKQRAHALVDALPDTASWADLIYQAVMHREIEAGLADSAAGRVIPVEDLMKEFGITQYEASIFQDIEEGMRDSEAGRVVSNADVRKMYGLPE